MRNIKDKSMNNFFNEIILRLEPKMIRNDLVENCH